MKYKITELSTSSMKVEYNDSSHAVIPIEKTYDTNLLKDLIGKYHNVDRSFEKVEDIPLALNYEGDTEEDLTTPNEFTYKDMRLAEYPNVGDQLGALNKSRLGDNSEITKIDEVIADVKAKYPKDNKKYTDADMAGAFDWTGFD